MISRTLFLFLMAACVALAAPSPTASPAPTASPMPTGVPSPTATPAPTAMPVATPAGTPISLREKVDHLSDDDIGKAITAIKEQFLDGGEVTDPALQRDLLEGLIGRLRPGVVLVDTGREPAPRLGTPYLSEILAAHIGYIRLGSVSTAVLPEVDATLKEFNGKKVDAVILDLRSVAEGRDYEAAAALARRFCSRNRMLFSIRKPSARQEQVFANNQSPAIHGVIVVLTDARTDGAAEVLAATLRQNAAAMIIGAYTPGGAAEFVDVPLSGKMVLRVATAQVVIPRLGSIFPKGVKPDIAIELPPDEQEEIFRESKDKGVSEFVFETERPRLNEAALVANLNPEIDSAQAYLHDRGKEPALRDYVLQRAVDLITAIDFYRVKQQ